MNNLKLHDDINVVINPNYGDVDIKSAFEKLQHWGIAQGAGTALKMHAYEGGRKRQTSERFTNKNNRKELLDTLIYIFGLVAYYPHFIKDGVGCEADNATPMLDNEKSFEVSNYPHIYDGVGNDTDESKNLLLGGYLHAMQTALQQYVSLAEGAAYKRSLGSLKQEVFLLFGAIGAYPEPSLTDKWHKPASYCIHPIEYTMFVIERLREVGYFDALCRMMDVLYGSGKGVLPEQDLINSNNTVGYSM